MIYIKKEKIFITKCCLYCLKKFETYNKHKKYCSNKCNTEVYKKRERQKRLINKLLKLNDYITI
jgi:predicted nucleic acid-binding Zn ribbon protein